MAFILNDLLSSLDSSIALLDSSSDLLEILQAINVTNPAKGYGKSRRKTYDSFAALPPASADFRGTLAVVQTVGNWSAPQDSDNGLYLCNGTQWTLIEGLDSAAIRPTFQGTSFGYLTYGTVIDKFSFTSDGNASNVGNLSTTMPGPANQRSQTHGYATYSNIIDKFPFANDGTATDIGDLSNARISTAGQSAMEYDYGYNSGGSSPPIVRKNIIDKFPFVSDANATDVGDLVYAVTGALGYSSRTHGYSAGGVSPPSPVTTNYVQKFPFASDTNATDVADLFPSGSISSLGASQNSEDNRYFSGGATPGGVESQIYKTPFASESVRLGQGSLTVARRSAAGQSSTVSGYTSGGRAIPPATTYNIIDKFPFSSNGNAADVGDLVSAGAMPAGTQV